MELGWALSVWCHLEGKGEKDQEDMRPGLRPDPRGGLTQGAADLQFPRYLFSATHSSSGTQLSLSHWVQGQAAALPNLTAPGMECGSA
jgi:hypothetical protein